MKKRLPRHVKANIMHWDILGISHIKKRSEASRNYDNYLRIKCKNCGDEKIRMESAIKIDEVCKICRFLPKEEAGVRLAYRAYKHNAKERKINFEISLQEFKDITSSNCHYCGSPPSNRIGNTEWRKYIYNGIDRKDNIYGYTLLNIVPCCKICNWAKGKMPYQKFIDYLNKIVEHRK